MPIELITTQKPVNLGNDTLCVHPSSYAKFYTGYRQLGVTNFAHFMRSALVDWQLSPNPRYQSAVVDLASTPTENFPASNEAEWEDLIAKNMLKPSLRTFLANYQNYNNILRNYPNNIGINPKIDGIIHRFTANEEFISEFYANTDSEAIRTVKKNMAITAALPLMRPLQSQNGNIRYRSIRAEAVASLNQIENQQYHSWRQKLVRFIMPHISKTYIAPSEPIQLTNGVDTAPVLNEARCTESHIIGGMGKTLFYTLRSEAHSTGLQYCIDKQCPLLLGGCIRAMILGARHFDNNRLPATEIKLQEMIAPENPNQQ
jgi:hypothetical protein